MTYLKMLILDSQSQRRATQGIDAVDVEVGELVEQTTHRWDVAKLRSMKKLLLHIGELQRNRGALIFLSVYPPATHQS